MDVHSSFREPMKVHSQQWWSIIVLSKNSCRMQLSSFSCWFGRTPQPPWQGFVWSSILFILCILFVNKKYPNPPHSSRLSVCLCISLSVCLCLSVKPCGDLAPSHARTLASFLSDLPYAYLTALQTHSRLAQACHKNRLVLTW